MKRTIILLVALIMVLTLVGCGTSSNRIDKSALEISDFKQIDGEKALVYSVDTKVVYYMFSTSQTIGYGGYGYAYFAPYISENGNFCRYINDEIVEITEKKTDN
ncbi:MAG: hypothetical protein IKT41_04775 [Clostridia bacterium]|nr:hypothetical protein [Clostridia bacterium]